MSTEGMTSDVLMFTLCFHSVISIMGSERGSGVGL
jgi:hypothetical protein